MKTPLPSSSLLLNCIQIHVFLLSALSRVSDGFKTKLHSKFIAPMHSGGLLLLYKLILQSSGENIVKALRIIGKRSEKPVVFYCSVGKDRTGLLALMLLHVLGAEPEAIVADYHLSDGVHGGDVHIISALQKLNLDAQQFLQAPRLVMEETIGYLDGEFGGVDAYLTAHGLTDHDREVIRSNLLVKPEELQERCSL